MNPRETEAALQKALELDPQNCRARIELGSLYEDQGRFMEAATEFERAIAIDPNHGGTHCQLGRICRKQGRLSEAEAALRKALALDSQDGWVRFELGVLYQDQGKIPEAAAEFEKATAIDPSQGGAHSQLGWIYRRLGRSFAAEAALRKALELDPRNVSARIELGDLYRDQGKFLEAVVEFEEAIAIDPNRAGPYCQLGRIYRRLGRSSEAEAALKKASELDLQDGGARMELGALYQDQGRFAEAAFEFESFVSLDVRNGWVFCELGRLYRRQGRPSEAEAALRKALELDSCNVSARIELGALYEDQDKSAEAAAEFEKVISGGPNGGVALKKALELEPNNVRAHLCMGHIHLRLGRWAEADAEFQRAAALDSRIDGAHVGLWAAYRGQGRAAEAEAALARAFAINPRSAFACTELMCRLDRDRVVGGNAQEPLRERVYCLLPWTHIHVFMDGSFRPCCNWSGPPLGDARSTALADLWNSPGLKTLRSDMMSGHPSAGCWKCYKDERSGSWSMRQEMNAFLGRQRGRESLTAPDGKLPRLPALLLDFRFSNVCNLRCRTCDPMRSSAWMEDARALGLSVPGRPIQKPYDDWDELWRQLRPLLEEGPEEILFVGGEPLLMEEHYRILDFLIARGLTDVRLTYNTNFSTLRFQGRDVIDLWSRFRKVTLVASLDGSGRRGEYLRKGLRWDEAVANREEMLRRCPEVAFSVLATLSIFNALHLPDFHREWVEKGYVDRNAFRLNILEDPALYRMQVLPAALKQGVLESYRRHRETFLDAGGLAARDFAAAARLLQAQDRSELLPEFVALTRRLDQLRAEDCGEVFPELAGLFEAAT